MYNTEGGRNERGDWCSVNALLGLIVEAKFVVTGKMLHVSIVLAVDWHPNERTEASAC